MNNQYSNIVIPLDMAHESSWRTALPIAIDHARQNQATLHVATVVPNADIPAIAVHLPSGIEQHIREEGEQAMQALVERLMPEDINWQVQIGQGRIYKEILHIAKKVDADLIVMASHRPELADYLIGANAAHVTRHAQCSVLVVREKEIREKELREEGESQDQLHGNPQTEEAQV